VARGVGSLTDPDAAILSTIQADPIAAAVVAAVIIRVGRGVIIVIRRRPEEGAELRGVVVVEAAESPAVHHPWVAAVPR
jgi:hypothetical protein